VLVLVPVPPLVAAAVRVVLARGRVEVQVVLAGKGTARQL